MHGSFKFPCSELLSFLIKFYNADKDVLSVLLNQ